MSNDLTRPFLVLSMASLLFACGGDDSNNSAAPPVNPNNSKLSALNGLSTSAINIQTQIDLAPFILGEKASTTISISSPSDPTCPPATLNGLHFGIKPTQAGWCDYVYQVYDDQGVQDEAVMTVIASREPTPLLPTISVTAAVDPAAPTNNIEIDLITTTELAAYQLIEDKVKVQAPDGMRLGEISFNGNSINYQPPTDHGWNYIQYALVDKTTDTTRVGYVFITLSDNVNTPPVIRPQTWHYPEKIKPGQTLLIELDKLQSKGLSICDGETVDESCDPNAWQLVGVSAMGANVTPANAELLGNKAFEFTSAVEGNYSVNYIVGDYDGGFTHGAMGILVDGNEDIKGWTDITVKPSYKYSAPLLGVDVPSDVNWSQNTVKEIINNKHYEVALWKATEAEAYCASINQRLPTADEMIRLNQSTDESVITERNKWPISKGYFVKDGEQYGAVTLKASNTHVGEVNEKNLRYATCYRDLSADFSGAPEYPTGESITADLALPIRLQITREGKGVEGVTVSHDSDKIVSCDDNTSASGELRCTYRNQTAGVHPVTFTADLISANQGTENIALTLDIKVMPDLNSVRLYTDKNSYDFIANKKNDVFVSKKDQFGNLVNGMYVVIKNDEISPDIGWTVSKAVQITSMTSPHMDLSDTGAAMLTLIPNKEGKAQFTLSSTDEGYNSPSVEPLVRGLIIKSIFSACGSGIDDTKDYSADDNCLKVVSDGDPISGALFTATPSAAVMVGLDYKVHNPTDSEQPSIPDTSVNKGNTYAGLKKIGNIPSFAIFRQDGGDEKGINGQADRWCQQLSTNEFLGRKTWRRAAITELKTLQTRIRTNNNYFGWPGYRDDVREWSSDLSWQSNYFRYLRLYSYDHYAPSSDKLFTSCTSPSEKLEPALIGICGDRINDDDKSNATGNCLKVTSDKDGNLISSTPSRQVIQTLGYSENPGDRDINDGKTYAGWQTENGSYGPSGQFALFDQKTFNGGHGTEGQYDRWCKDLAAMNFANVNTWRRINADELKKFNAMYVDGTQNTGLFNKFGWPVGIDYWSSTSNNNNHYMHMSLRQSNNVTYAQADQRRMAACIAKGAMQRR